MLLVLSVEIDEGVNAPNECLFIDTVAIDGRHRPSLFPEKVHLRA